MQGVFKMNKIRISNNEENLKYVILYAKKIKKTNFSEKIRKQHNELINSQIEIANNFYQNLAAKKEFNKISKLTGLSLKQSKRIFTK